MDSVSGPTASVRVVDVYPYRVHGTQCEWLVLRRAADRAYAGQWRMVGGKIHSGETAWQAALRELAEETGFTPGHGLAAFWALPSVNIFYEWQRDAVSLTPAFAAEVTGDPQLDAEHDAFDWLPAAEAVARLVWPEQRRLLTLASDLVGAGDLPVELAIPLE
ncbi:MAG: NUDIX domain-containing protein [Rubricoccaceae bacterium]